MRIKPSFQGAAIRVLDASTGTELEKITSSPKGLGQLGNHMFNRCYRQGIHAFRQGNIVKIKHDKRTASLRLLKILLISTNSSMEGSLRHSPNNDLILSFAQFIQNNRKGFQGGNRVLLDLEKGLTRGIRNALQLARLAKLKSFYGFVTATTENR